MDYRVLFREENEAVKERLELSVERLREIRFEETVEEPYRDYFQKMAEFALMIDRLRRDLESGKLKDAGLPQLQDLNHRLYEDLLPGNYEKSYADPACAVRRLGREMGRLLSFFYAELRGEIVFAYESRLTEIAILNETLIEIYNMFEEETPRAETVGEVLYWFVSDYSDITVAYRVREGLDPRLSFAKDIVMEEDLTDLRYLYRYGEYISDSQLQTAGFLNSLPGETIRLMADTFTEGYRHGFVTMGRDLSKKKTVMLRYELGFERMVRASIENFERMSLEVILCRAPVWSISRSPVQKAGYHGSSPNRQYDYDHRYDSAVYLSKALKDRKLAVMKAAYERYKREGALYGGPALIETFGQEKFDPVNKPEALALSEKQEELVRKMDGEAALLSKEYVPRDETSFTIIAFPVPEIGEKFQEIFRETIVVNTLNCEKYRDIQQAVIDALDQAVSVTVTGRGQNRTNLSISLHPLAAPDRETNFENALADVNIPVGEVFTSPVLSGTGGTLHVGAVYIGGFQFQDLTLTFCDGMVKDYSCGNFESEQEGKALVKQVILKNHDTLPMGEFAIGTNTYAYAMAQRYGILDKLPILIAEKLGPHFAVGDTCYSWTEDSPMYNPDGREVIAKDNEVSILRKEDVSKAYFNCHTDITLPYAELDKIQAVRRDGSRISIIDGGRFVLPGTEALNEPLQ